MGAILAVAAGCCGTPATSDATKVAAADNVAGWGLALTYVRDWGRAETPEAQAERARTLDRIAAWGAQADMILAAIANDREVDVLKSLAAWAERAHANPAGAAGPGPAPAPNGAGP